MAAILAAFVVVGAIDSMRRSGYVYDPRVETPNPSIVRERPEEILAEVVERYGGLPSEDIDEFIMCRGLLNPCFNRQGLTVPDSVTLEPVESYEVVSVKVSSAQQPFPLYILDDDPVYGIEARVEVTFADGDQSSFLLSSWRYGLFLGFLTVPYGDGPPWQWRAAG